MFDATLTPELLETLRVHKPILVWIDCDYYTSARAVLERLIPYLPSGCVIYFDEYEFNFGSRFTGESRLVHEINRGEFGDGIELVLDSELSWDLRRCYRFINRGAAACSSAGRSCAASCRGTSAPGTTRRCRSQAGSRGCARRRGS